MSVVFNKISVIGLGYIGLPTATMLATSGIKVVGVDIDEKTVATINAGKVHIVEPELEGLLQQAVAGGYLRAVTKPESADVFLITVPTPCKEDHSPDLTYVKAAMTSIAPLLSKTNLIILESTSPLGTTEAMSRYLASLRPDLSFPHQQENADIHMAYCPERVMPGQIIRELVANDRVIGGMTQGCSEYAKAFYKLFVKGECITTDAKTSEMAKLTENAFRDVNIAFANELSMICEPFSINVWELIKLANRHPRVNILQPGPGVGGHCIAVDPWFIVDAAPKEAKLIRTAREVNDSKPQFVIDKIKDLAKLTPHPVIACLGLSYKANTDDLRESPAIKILQAVQSATKEVVNVVEPHITQLPPALNQPCFKLMDLTEALAASNIILFMVNHKAFRTINEKELEGKMVFNIANVEAEQEPFMQMAVKRQQGRVSDFGMMMMNRIYGQVFS